MTNEELLAKIKAEIKRRKKLIDGLFTEGDIDYYSAQDDAYNELLYFLDTLQVKEFPAGLDEKPRKRLRKVNNWIEEAKYEIEHQEEVLEERLQELHKIRAAKNLDEAAEEYSKRVSNGHHYRDLQCGFKAGAEWMAGQGVIIEGEVVSTDENRISIRYTTPCYPTYHDYIYIKPIDCTKGDKVVVQIRKK